MKKEERFFTDFHYLQIHLNISACCMLYSSNRKDFGKEYLL